MRLIRLLIGIVLLVGLVYFVVAVPLGDKTLVDHIRAIAGTKEGKALIDGVKQKASDVTTADAGAKKVIDRVKRGAADVMDKAAEALRGDAGVKDPPADHHSAEDQRKLREIIRNRGQVDASR